MLFCNPGEVFYRAGDNTPLVPVWFGDVDEDLCYSSVPQCVTKPTPLLHFSNMGIAGKPVLIGKTAAYYGYTNMGENLSSGISYRGRLDPKQLYFLDDSAMVDWHVPLALVHPQEIGYEHAIFADEVHFFVFISFYMSTKNCIRIQLGPHDPKLMFRYAIPTSRTFTVESFATTRFGSHRKRPDHEQMKRIQHSASRFQQQLFSPSATLSDSSLAGTPRPHTAPTSSIWPPMAGSGTSKAFFIKKLHFLQKKNLRYLP